MKPKKIIAPGIWIDEENNLHIDPSPLLKAHGFEDTEENREKVLDEVKRLTRKENPKLPIVDVFD